MKKLLVFFVRKETMTVNLRTFSRKYLRIKNSRLKLKRFLLLKITGRLLKTHTPHKFETILRENARLIVGQTPLWDEN